MFKSQVLREGKSPPHSKSWLEQQTFTAEVCCIKAVVGRMEDKEGNVWHDPRPAPVVSYPAKQILALPDLGMTQSDGIFRYC